MTSDIPRLTSVRLRTSPDKDHLPLSPIRRRVHVLMRLIPIGLMLFVLIYEFGVTPWLQFHATFDYHLIDIAIYGMVGPVLAYLVLHFLDRWLEERETSELQARLLNEAQLRAKISTELSDDALQTLFAASVLIASLRSTAIDQSPASRETLAQTQQALDRAIQQIRSHLLER